MNKFKIEILKTFTQALIISFALCSSVQAEDSPNCYDGVCSDPVFVIPGLDNQSVPVWIEGEDSQANLDVQEEIIGPAGAKSMIFAFDNWNDGYRGYQRTPILFDPRRDPNAAKVEGSGSTRKYPALSRHGIARVGLTADDEIKKSAMAIFQPVRSMEASFANDTSARDDYFGMLNTVRGIAQLTLGYLDRTVAAGLATIQQQAGADTQNHILKQISLTSARLAHPQRESLFNDIDEKFEACMNGDMGSGRFSDFECDEGDPILEGPACGFGSRQEASSARALFRYCSCCAERSLSINKTTEESPADEPFSLVERLFYGTGIEATEPGSTAYKEVIENYVKLFKTLYGDVLMVVENGNGGASSNGKVIKTKFMYPGFSVPELIRQLRNGPPQKGPDRTQEPCATTFCPITNGRVFYGICPALSHLIDPEILKEGLPTGTPTFRQGLTDYPSILSTDFPVPETGKMTASDPYAKVIHLWAEASLGTLFTADDISKMQKQLSNDPGSFFRSLDTLCDSSAVAAFKRLHKRMISIALDHLTLNTRATATEKAQLQQLMSRTSSYLSLAEQDVDAGYRAEEHKQSLVVEAERKQIARQQMNQAGINAHIATSNSLNTVFFGGGAMPGTADADAIQGITPGS